MVSVVDELGLPVKFVGVGEGIEDLQVRSELRPTGCARAPALALPVAVR